MTEQDTTQQRIDDAMGQRHNLAVEAYQQVDNAEWTRMWDKCADLARQAAELAETAGDSDQAASLRRIAADNTSKADVFRGRQTAN